MRGAGSRCGGLRTARASRFSRRNAVGRGQAAVISREIRASLRSAAAQLCRFVTPRDGLRVDPLRAGGGMR